MYAPDNTVKVGHSIPHVGVDGKLYDSTFTYSEGYLQSLIPVPAVILGIGLLSILIYMSLMCFRCCCECIRYAPNRDDYLKDNAPITKFDWAHKVVSRRRLTLFLFVTFLFFTFAVNHILFWGDATISQGVSDASDGLNSLGDTFAVYSDATGAFVASYARLGQAMSDVTCQEYNSQAQAQVSSTLSSFEGYATVLNDAISDIAPNIYSASDTFITYGTTKKSTVVYIFYAFIAFDCILLALAAIIRNKVFMQVLLSFSLLIVIALTVICCIEMVIVMLLSDFCMDPIEYISTLASKLFGSTSSIYQAVDYYTTCSGSMPYTSDLISVNTELLSFQTQLNGLQTAGCSDSDLTLAIQETSTLITSLTVLTNELSACTSIQLPLKEIIENSSCVDTINGFFIIWICQFLCSGFLYFTICAASVLYQYFDFWTLREDGSSVDDVSGDAKHNYKISSTASAPPQPTAPNQREHVTQKILNSKVESDDCGRV